MKPGYKTTEFWLSAAAGLCGMLMASGAFSGGPVAQVLGMAATTLAGLGYTWSRTSLK